MGQPKRKPTSSRTRMRRAHHALTAAARTTCPRCKNPKRPHAICPVCGTYAGKVVLEPKEN